MSNTAVQRLGRLTALWEGIRNASECGSPQFTQRDVMLDEFVRVNRKEIVKRCKAKATTRSVPPPIDWEINRGVPVFLDQLVEALRLGLHRALRSAGARFNTGMTCCVRE